MKQHYKDPASSFRMGIGLIVSLLIGFFVLLSQAGAAQNQQSRARQSAAATHRISGTVRDNLRVLLPGVSVTVKGKTNIGTTTDVNGGFFLEIPDKDAIIVFSMVGYTLT
jgi:hypothetical protein